MQVDDDARLRMVPSRPLPELKFSEKGNVAEWGISQRATDKYQVVVFSVIPR